ncbi:helicase HerA-like domain-containing protein [Shewanella sp. GXUN23E]|uniref:helicase HerA-like domain-containing protein n=1 Tax=Shewanella sp. GXUN23E TaxID=3422498 RepID=UPI003D7EB59D
MNQILLGGNGNNQVFLNAAMANRHGLIAGATGTGKTISLQLLAESFSQLGTPCFLADVKGDLSGLAAAGSGSDKLQSRCEQIGVPLPAFAPCPVLLWDIFGKLGLSARTTISEMGPLLLASLLELNDTQTGVLYGCFDYADEQGLLLLDMKDLRALLAFMAENAKSLSGQYGNISASSVGAIQRRLLVLEQQGAEHFFAEPALALTDLMQTDFSGKGVISILDVTTLIHQSPKLYATFLLWLLAELFEQLPEQGDADKPRLVLFFDEAHLLFNTAPKPLIDKVEQVVRLIRSKGVGVFFISQSPMDIPEAILGQLGCRIQHALRAFTPKDKKNVKAVADNFRPNPGLNTAEVITELGTGEALVSVLDTKGRPQPVEKILMCPPASRIGPLSQAEREQLLARSPLTNRYRDTIDRESAFELLAKRRDKADTDAPQPKADTRAPQPSRRGDSAGDAFFKSLARTFGSKLGQSLVRGILGALKR